MADRIGAKAALVFCSSSTDVAPVFAAEMQSLVNVLSRKFGHIVFGGSKLGLMGVLADEAMAQGCRLTGVMPEFMRAKDVVHSGLDECHWTKDLHERKRVMVAKSHSVVCFPGGIGTLDEFMEVLALKQLGQMDHSIYLLNAFDFYEPLLDFITEVQQQRMISPNLDDLFKVVSSSTELEKLL